MKKVLLGDIIELVYGKSLPQRSRVSGRFPVFGSNGQVDMHNKYLVGGPGIIVGRKGSVGEVIWSKQDFWPIDTTYYVKLKNPDDDLRYWYYVLKTLGLNKLNSHSAIPGLNRDVAYIKQVPLRSTLEQEKIANILGSLDEKIELNRHMNETLEQLGQALFRHYFVDNPAAKSWDKKPLDEIANFLNGLAMQKYPKINGQPTLPVIKIREMSSGITDSTDIASANIPEEYIVRDGDLLFSWSGTLMVKFWSGGDGALNQHLFKVTSDKYPEWLYYYWVKYHLDQFILIAKSKATTMGHIQRKHLKQAEVIVPPNIEEMTSEFTPIIDQIKTNLFETNSLVNIRDTLLPKLISGEIEV
ncbi:MAG: restriction endonuclease subunit S [Candidatus Saccharibacteria bacterium]